MLSHSGAILIFCSLSMMFSYGSSIQTVTGDSQTCYCLLTAYACKDYGGSILPFACGPSPDSVYCCFDSHDFNEGILPINRELTYSNEKHTGSRKDVRVPEAGQWAENIRGNVNMPCEPYQTECAFGCCPYAEGVCCVDGFECCQHGQTCIPILGICIGLENKNGEYSLVSNKSTSVKSSIPCPHGTTPCGEGCCPFENATCCSDKVHCCPHDYRCDLTHMKCIATNSELDNELDGGAKTVPTQKTVSKSSYKSCPGRGKVCPSSTSCCINDYNDWDCCPKPLSPQIRSGDPICCKSIWGRICCNNKDYPFCTPLGCI